MVDIFDERDAAQKPNIHIGICGSCGGNVTHQAPSQPVPRCEQCGAEPLLGATLLMKPENEIELPSPVPGFSEPEPVSTKP